MYPDYILTILQASITGAGLVAAAYTLILLRSKDILKRKVDKLAASTRSFKEKASKTSVTSTSNHDKEIEKYQKQMKRERDFPQYLGSFALFSFLLFILSALLAIIWIYNPTWTRIDLILGSFFFTAIILFGIMGGYGIREIYLVLKKEFEELKTQDAFDDLAKSTQEALKEHKK